MKIDNFALTMHQTCPAKFDLRMNEGWTARRRSGALGAGAALHAGIAEWYRTGEIGKALLAINDAWPEGLPVDDWRTKEKCIATMIEYVKVYPSETFMVVGAPDAPVVEVPFTLDLGMYLPCWSCGDADKSTPDNPECACCGALKEMIEYGGIYDMLVEFSGHLYVVDHKTTSVMGSGYFNQFKPNNQMTGYIWAAQQMSSKRVSGAIINAIGWYKASKTKFDREITSRSPAAIEEWKLNVYHECVGIQHHRKTGFWPMRTGSCTQYGLCEYWSVHNLEYQIEREKRLETDYVREKWDYEVRDG